MKSIFTRPLFINPQAYLTIPELSYIQTATPFDFTEDSYSFVINTSGRIEGKLLKTSNDYILHLDLYSIDGNCVLGEFYLNNSELNIDNFNLIQSKNIITLEFGEQSSGNITYPGLIAAWSAKGKTNDDKDRAILKDLTGNGHDITLNGFAFSEMSGYGGYDTNFTNKKDWSMNNDGGDNTNPDYNINYTSTYFKIQKTDGGLISSTNVLRYKANKVGKFRFKINTDGTDLEIKQVITSIEGKVGVNVLLSNINSNEVYEIDLPTYSVEEYKTHQVIFNTKDATFLECWMLPEYPDALVFDGIDDYGVNENMPILTDYTIIAKRKDYTGASLFTKGLDIYNSAFVFEGKTFIRNTYNFGEGINVNLLNDFDISWQTKLFYNEQPLLLGRHLDTKGAFIGKISKKDNRFFKGAFYSAYLFNRSLDKQEIKAFIRKYIDPEYLLPSEIPTPDCYYDFSKGSNDDETHETIKDYSGNGNDAVAHNFAWSGMSGYGGYSLLIPSVIDNRFEYEKVNGKFVFKKALIVGSYLFNPIPRTSVYDDFNISINNIGARIIRIVNSSGGAVLKEYNANGIYTIKKEEIADIDIVIKTDYNENQEMNNLTIEFLPKYPDSLVFDGVDDYVSLDAFDSGFKTVFMVCKWDKVNTFLYDQRQIGTSGNQWGIYTSKTAYNYRNAKGVTYINSILNTSLLSNALLQKKHCITIVNENIEPNRIPIIGVAVGNVSSFANMALYKFLGFKEALTEEQIQYVIKKHNLLDGVDEIEVS